MKKVIVVMLALFLAIPAITYAGSVTSRYDVTIGGFVKFDVGWASQGQSGDYIYASPGSITGNTNVVDKYPNSFMASGETRLNILVKGPDAWGAKTGAFIEGQFRGGASYEGFQLRHAYMTFNWTQNQLLIGQSWQTWGLLPSFNLLGYNELGPMNKGDRIPQIMFTQKFGKNWSLATGLVSSYAPTIAGGTRTSTNVTSATAQSTIFSYPNFEAELGYKSDACGKIGPWMLQAALSGFIGQNKIAKRTGAAGTDYESSNVTNWGAAFKAYVPIIPEKKGNKAGALAVSGSIFVAQGPNAYFGPYIADAYISDAAGSSTTARNGVVSGGWGDITYYMTDSLFVNGLYGYTAYNWSNANRGLTQVAALANGIPATMAQNVQHTVLNFMYDVSPAIRLGVGWTHLSTGYADTQAAGSGGKSGSMDVGRASAWYFF